MHIVVIGRKLYAVLNKSGRCVKTGTFGQCHDHVNHA